MQKWGIITISNNNSMNWYLLSVFQIYYFYLLLYVCKFWVISPLLIPKLLFPNLLYLQSFSYIIPLPLFHLLLIFYFHQISFLLLSLYYIQISLLFHQFHCLHIFFFAIGWFFEYYLFISLSLPLYSIYSLCNSFKRTKLIKKHFIRFIQFLD